LRILRNRFGRRISRWSDIRDISASDFKRRTGIDSPTLISGGFPCQPFSLTGTRRGTADDRYLWPEMFRIVRELRPSWVIGENVTGIVSMELEHCCSDLEGEGYTVRSFLIPACGVGAPHRRDRCFVVAHADVLQPGKHARAGADEARCRGSRAVSGREVWGEDVADAEGAGLANRWIPGGTPPTFARPERGRAAVPDADHAGGPLLRPPHSSRRPAQPVPWDGGGWWAAEPRVGRVAHGVPHRVDRLRGLGNAVVPQQIYPILAGIAQIEQETMT